MWSKAKKVCDEMRKGSTVSAEVRKKMSESKRGTKSERMERDLKLLRTLGQAKTWEYAEAAGVEVQVGKDRLYRLYKLGLVDRHKERGHYGWTYEAKET
jgi:hypothetical protein